jgi:hypothetical protein
MAIELYAPISKDYEKKIDDFHLEVITDTITGGTNTLTLGTDTSVVNHCHFAFGVNRTGTPAAVSISTPGTGAVSTTVVNNGANAAHDMFIFGGERGLGAGDAFYFNQYNGQNSPSDFLWELIELTLSGTNEKFEGVGTGDEDLSIVARPMYVMVTEIRSGTEPNDTGVSVSEISSIDFTIYGRSGATMLCLVGGLREGTVPADDTGTDAAVYGDRSFLLPNAKNVYNRPKNALIGEIVDLTLGGESPSVEPILTSSLNFIKQSIEGIFPMDTNAGEEAVAWNGTRGTSSGITGKDASTHVVKCLVVGY